MNSVIAFVTAAVKFVSEHWDVILAAVNGLLAALIAIFVLIPGPHPEDWFQAAADFLKKFSKK